MAIACICGLRKSQPAYDLSISLTNTTVSVTRNGSPVSAGTGVLTQGDVLTITASAGSGYELSTLTVNGVAFTSGNTYTVTGNVTIVAVGEQQSGIAIQIIENSWQTGYAFDGQDDSGRQLELTEGTNNVNITSGYVYMTGDDPGGRVDAGYFAGEPTCTGGVTLISYTAPEWGAHGGIALFRVTGTGTITCTFECLIEGTQITLADGSTKAIEDITYDDELLVWDFYKGELSSAKPIWIKEEGIIDWYSKVRFSNGTELGSVGRYGHRIFTPELNKFTYTSESPNGTKTYTLSGEATVVSQERINEHIKFYNVITEKHYNLFANGILTSCRLSNEYRIEDMKYVGERLITDEIIEKYFKDKEYYKKPID